MVPVLWMAAFILLVLWLIGLFVNWGNLTWALLAMAGALLIINVVSLFTRGRRY